MFLFLRTESGAVSWVVLITATAGLIIASYTHVQSNGTKPAPHTQTN